jgi:hypothetical protein
MRRSLNAPAPDEKQGRKQAGSWLPFASGMPFYALPPKTRAVTFLLHPEHCYASVGSRNLFLPIFQAVAFIDRSAEVDCGPYGQ